MAADGATPPAPDRDPPEPAVRAPEGKAPKTGSLIGSVATVGSITLISRVLGFVRDILIAALLGAGPLADAFFVAFKLPNFLRRLFAEGAFNAGFVPLFARTIEGEGRAIAKAFAEEAQAILLAVLLPLVIVAIIAMPWVIAVMAPGFERDGIRYLRAVELSRITFVYILFISLVALQAGILNSLGRFAAAAAAPIILNLCLIGALLLSAGWLEAPAQSLAVGVALAGLAQFLWLRLAVRQADLVPAFRRPRLTPRVKRLFALILPGAFGAGVAQINLFADVIFASLLPPGAVSFLYYADRVNQLPVGVIGVAVGTALLPLMARQLRAGEREAALASQNRAIELSLLLTIPAAVGLAVLSLPIVAVLFERGAFIPAESRATAAALGTYALGLPAYVLIKVLAPGFFAREDTKTPVKIAVVCLVANVGFALALIWHLAHVGIALATVLSAWLNAGLLAFGLRRDGRLQPDAQLKRRLPRVMAASLAMAVALWITRPLLTGLPPSLMLLTLIALGGCCFLALAQAGGAMDLRALQATLRGRRA